MTLLRRIGFMLLLNIAVIFTIQCLLSFFGIGHGTRLIYGHQNFQMTSLLAYCFIWGMTGAFISLLLSKWMAKWMMGVVIISPQTRSAEERNLFEMVKKLSKAAGLSRCPEVGIYPSSTLNAFATGPSENHSLVAVSQGLLQSMSDAQIEGVLAHEIAHIRNGDMVTMTLLQGTINSFSMFLSYILSSIITQLIYRNEKENNAAESHYMVRMIIRQVCEVVFMVLGSLVLAWFSRLREYRADAGGARYAGREKMTAALRALKRNLSNPEPETSSAFKSLQISSNPSRFFELFSTHPPLDERIRRVSQGLY